MIYVALLRGINVGGKNKINMKTLALSFEEAGMTSVTTYINSGNIIFQNDRHSQSQLAQILEEVILKDFKLAIKVLIMSYDQMTEIMEALPSDWQNNKEMKSDVLFLWEEIDRPEVLEELTFKPEIETVIYVPGAILWSISRDLSSRSGMQKLASHKLYKQMTIRNVNSARKIYQIMQEKLGEN